MITNQPSVRPSFHRVGWMTLGAALAYGIITLWLATPYRLLPGDDKRTWEIIGGDGKPHKFLPEFLMTDVTVSAVARVSRPFMGMTPSVMVVAAVISNMLTL